MLGGTHKYKKIHELFVCPFGFLKYAHKLQEGKHFATKDELLLNFLRGSQQQGQQKKESSKKMCDCY
jgi:hypothetical protein